MQKLRATAALVVGALALAGCATSQGPPGAVSIVVSDTEVLADQPVSVAVEGLTPGAEVTLWARGSDDLRRTWLSFATFTADSAGRVDVPTAVPTAGTYAGPDPMGLFRSMRPADDTPPGPPFPVSADPAARVALTATVDGADVATAEVVQRIAAPGVRSEPVRTDGLVGTLHLPPGPGPHPGVVLLGGSEGGIPAYPITDALASRGFATLALAYFREDGLPAELVGIPLEYFERAFGWLRARPEVTDGPLGVIGSSRGGELALLLGATFPDVGAVVSYVGSGLGYGGLSQQWTGTFPAAWTRAGADVPFIAPAPDVVTATGRYLGSVLLGAPVTDVAGTWPDLLAAGPAAHAAAEIPVERIAGPVLLLSGRDDRLWPSTPLSDVALRRLESGGHPYPHEHHAYAGAGHFFFSVPYLSPFPTELGSPYGALAGGGSAEANARAAADAWTRVLQTLRTGLVPS